MQTKLLSCKDAYEKYKEDLDSIGINSLKLGHLAACKAIEGVKFFRWALFEEDLKRFLKFKIEMPIYEYNREDLHNL